MPNCFNYLEKLNAFKLLIYWITFFIASNLRSTMIDSLEILCGVRIILLFYEEL